jgi:hypothetical protein
MLIPLGILASSGGVASDYEHIATALGDASTGTLTLTSIPSDYKHLQVRYFARNTANSGTLRMRINGVTATSYSKHELIGSASTASSTASTSQNNIEFLTGVSGTGSPGSSFRAGVIDILDYTSTSKNTTVRALYGGADTTQVSKIALLSGLFNNTAAVTSLTFLLATGNFDNGAIFALYGIKG